MKPILFLAIALLAGCDFIESLDQNRFAPRVTLNVSPNQGQAPLWTEITWTVTDEDGSATACALDFGDGTTETVENCRQVTTTFHEYKEAGRFVLTVTADDGEFETKATRGVNVTNGAALNVTLTADEKSGKAPLLVEFTWATDGNPDMCSIDFGDKNSEEVDCETGKLFHTYESAGPYVATISVSKGSERAYSSVGVRVSE